MLVLLKKDCSYSNFLFVHSNELKQQKNEEFWNDLTHSPIQNLSQVSTNCDFLQPGGGSPPPALSEIVAPP